MSDSTEEHRDQLQEIVEDLEELQDESTNHELRSDLEETIDQVRDLNVTPSVFGQVIKKYTSRDIGESIVGAVLFSLPLLVEDGVFDIADFFLAHTVLGIPFFLVLNVVFVLSIPVAILYWADFQQVVPKRPLFGVIPRRYIGVVVVSFLTAAAMMTLWGRVENWEDPLVAFARISCVAAAGALGASLGDILPGQSAGPDISETFGNMTDKMGLTQSRDR